MTCCGDCVSHLDLDPWEELAQVFGEREIWASLFKLLPPQPDPGLGRGWMDPFV